MASYTTKYGSQYNGASGNQLQTNVNNQPYSSTNQYNSGTADYQVTGEGNSEEYSGYSSYGATGNDNVSNQNYYPNNDYSCGDSNLNNQTGNNAPKQTYSSGYSTNNNSSGYNTNNNSSGYNSNNNSSGYNTNNKKSGATTYNQNNSNNSRGYASFGQFRQHYASRPQNQNSQAATSQNAPTLFMGRDQSYPNELNNLMNPFFCGVCDARLNSIKSANIHYESKAHDKHITTWLKKTYTDNGVIPPEVQRFVTEMNSEAPGVYHCDLCKLELSSAQHALQHFNGKRHRQAVSKVSPPSGIGYFNVEGKWVQTGKLIDKVTGKETSYVLVKTPTGFEPVVLQVLGATNVPSATSKRTLQQNEPDEPPAKKLDIETNLTDIILKKKQEQHYRGMLSDFETRQQQQVKDPKTITVPQVAVKKKPALPVSTNSSEYQTLLLQSQESQQSLQSPQEALDSLNCKVCGIATTSKDQMLMHLKGSRHTKKLKALGERPMVFQATPATILESLDTNDPSDISMYRTPSGSYYCKPCNAAVIDAPHMERHILSKKHLMALKVNSTEALSVSDGSKTQ